MTVQIVGPFRQRKLVVDGFTVPAVEALENDGGSVTFFVDERLAWTVPVSAFEDVAELVAAVYAIGLGLPCNPRDSDEDDSLAMLERVPILMRPRRVHEIVGVSTDEVADGDP